jgi:hypothetical protein
MSSLPCHALALVVAVSALHSSRLGAQADAYSCADTTSRTLGFLLGEYSASTAFRAGPRAWESARATVTIRRELGGCVLREHYVGTRYGAPYEYLALWSANGGASAPVQRSFVHSQHGILGVSKGRVAGDSLVLDDSSFVRGRWVFERFVLWREGGASNVLQSEGRRSEDGRASWFPTQRTRYARQAGRGETGRARPQPPACVSTSLPPDSLRARARTVQPAAFDAVRRDSAMVVGLVFDAGCRLLHHGAARRTGEGAFVDAVLAGLFPGERVGPWTISGFVSDGFEARNPTIAWAVLAPSDSAR